MKNELIHAMTESFEGHAQETENAQAGKLDALKTHKKGLMQQLFPREGETVPRLRFPEFREAGEWVRIQLWQLGELVSGLTYSPDDVRDEGLLVLRSSNIQNGVISLQDNVYVRPDIKGANLSKPDDILICVRNGSKPLIGKNALIPPGLPRSTHGAFMSAFRARHPKFVYQLFQTDAYERQVAADLGATINSINGNTLRKYEFDIPESKEEQHKIADCLASLDTLIAAEAEKLVALKTHKQGLMQQLFPREGETVPRLRFPEFRDAGEWEEKAVGDVGQVVTGSTPSTANPEYYGGNIGFVSPADISDLRFVDKTKTSLTELGFAQTRPIPACSVLVVCIGSTIGKIAQNTFDCATNQQINSVLPNSDHDAAFLYYLLARNSDSIAKLAGKHAVPIVNKTLFSSVSLLVPELDEQRRIADCLSSLDALIAAQTEKLDALKVHKQGLMQQLFPNPEAVAA